jgi:hypothetical protein
MTARGTAILDQEWQSLIDWAKDSDGARLLDFNLVMCRGTPPQIRDWFAHATDDELQVVSQIVATALLEIIERPGFGVTKIEGHEDEGEVTV